MIKSIRLMNFFSFGAQTIGLDGLNVLIGINGVGKSNLIKAIHVLKAVISDGDMSDLIINKWGGFDAVHYLGDNRQDPKIELEYEFDPFILGQYGYHFQEPVFYRIRFHKVASSQNYYICESFHTKSEGRTNYRYMQMDQGKGFVREGLSNNQETVRYELDNAAESILCQLVDKDRYYQIYTLREAIKDIVLYNYFDTTAKSDMRKPIPPGPSSRLLPDGSNLPLVLNSIKINDKNSYTGIADALNAVNPLFNGFDFNFLGTSIELLLDERGLNKSVHVTHISDGTLRYLCLLSIIFNHKRGKLVCIDEPEVGLHPDMVGELMQAILQTTGETQYVISTHSDHILNQVSVENIIVFEKDENNKTSVKSFKDKEFVNWASQYAAGSLWRNGDLGGNRY